MQHRFLGNSGLKVSEVTYGNWLTHGSQIENQTAIACVHAAFDAGITTFDTADTYANTVAESVLGEALSGISRESVEIMTKVFWPTGLKGPNDCGLSRKHILESINASLRRLGTDHVDVYQAHRYDHETPLEETMLAFADVVRQGKALYIGVSEWTAGQIRVGKILADELQVPLVSNQPQYNMLWRVIEAEVVPTCRELGLGQVVWSPIAQGVLTGKYAAGQPAPEGTRAAAENVGASVRGKMSDQILTRVQGLRPLADELGLTMAQLAIAWVLMNHNVASALVGASRPEQIVSNAEASGVTLPPEAMARIDEILADVVERDPSRTAQSSPDRRPC